MSTGEPVRIRYPLGPAEGLSPDPRYPELRREQPVCRLELPGGGEAWLVTRYAEARTVLTDPRFRRAVTQESGKGEDGPPAGMATMDPREHTRMRRLVSETFTPQMVERLRPRIERISSDLLADMATCGQPADLVEHYASPFPVASISEMLGIPTAERDRLRALSEQLMAVTARQDGRWQDAYGQAEAYLRRLAAQHRAAPRDDLIGTLITAHRKGKITEHEVIELPMAMLVAGYESISNQIGNYAYVLLSHPEHWSQLRKHRELVSRAVEELARYIPFGNGTLMHRIATSDVTLGPVRVRAGEVVLIAGEAANRDEDVFPDGDRLDFERESNPHLAFGFGPHYCLGAHIVRLELQTAVRHLIDRFPRLRLAVPFNQVAWKAGLSVRGPRELPVAW